MIENVVFDMGNVLLDYNPMRLIAGYTRDPADRAAIDRALFASPEWALLDEGLITDADMLRAALAHLPERLHGMTRDMFAIWPTLYRPIPETERLVRRLKANGYRCYLLSNASLRWYSYEQDFPVFALLDGRIISASCRTVKPKDAIYRALFDTYSLLPETCFFIDDMPANVEGARRNGMDGFVLDSRQYAALESALTERGVRLHQAN